MKEKNIWRIAKILMSIGVVGMLLSIWFMNDLDRIIVLLYMLIIFFVGFVIGNKCKRIGGRR